MYQDGINEGKSIGTNQEKINISYGISGSTEGTDGYYYIYVYMTDGNRTKGGWVNTSIQVPQEPDPGPGGNEGDLHEAYNYGVAAREDYYFEYYKDALSEGENAALNAGYSNSYAMGCEFANGYFGFPFGTRFDD